MSEKFTVIDGVLTGVAHTVEQVIRLPEGIHTISSSAFDRNRRLSSVRRLIVSEGVTTIKKGALSLMLNLEVLELPRSLRCIEEGALANDSNLTIIKCKSDNIEYLGNPFADNDPHFNRYPKNDPRNILAIGSTLFSYFGPERLVAIPDGIKCIWTGAFADNKSVTQVVLPSSVSTIMPGAFDNCPNLREVIISDSMEIDVPYEMFINCPRVNSVTTSSALGELAKYEDITASLNVLIKYMGEIKYSISFPKTLNDLFCRAAKDLETVVKNQDVMNAIAMVEHYGYINQTARSLLIAGRYKGAEYTRELLKRGFTFNYRSDSILVTDSVALYNGGKTEYKTQYYLGIIPRVVSYKDVANILNGAFACFHNAINIENFEVSLEQRIEVIDTYLESPLKFGVSADLMLWFAIVRGEFEIAEHLMNKGIDLNSDVPYFCPHIDEDRTFIEILAGDKFSGYYKKFINELSCLKGDNLSRALHMLNELAARTGKRICLNQSALVQLNYKTMSEELFQYIVNDIRLSGVSKKKTLVSLLNDASIDKFKMLVDRGWIKSVMVRDTLIDIARENNQIEVTAWLIDYKNRTADEVAEEARATELFMKELMADPSDPFIIRKNWVYRKKKDGSIKITNYIGSDTNIQVPSKVGDAMVTEIGAKCFSPSNTRMNNIEARKCIQSITFPDSVLLINDSACLGCKELTSVKLPENLIELGIMTFYGCEKLASIVFPESLTSVPSGAFYRCSSLDNVVFPSSIRSIKESAFFGCGLTSIVIPNTVSEIGYGAFKHNPKLETLYILCDSYVLYSTAFMFCDKVKEVYVGDNTNIQIGYSAMRRTNPIELHTNEYSLAAHVLEKNTSLFTVVYDFFP